MVSSSSCGSSFSSLSWLSCVFSSVLGLGLILLNTAPLIGGQSSLCPQECACLGELVDCTQRKLTTIPSSIGRHVTKLHLQDNKIVTIPDGSFTALINLKQLMLSNNKLTDDINGESFRGLVSLRKLGLSRNKLTTVPFLGDHLGNLTRLLLGSNKITEIPQGVFDSFQHLRMLDLSNNKIREIPTGTFGQLKNLFRLVLSSNRIAQISPGSLNNLTGLSSLNLGKNRLESLPQDVFSKQDKLTMLDMSNNQLHRIHHLAFKNLNKLGILNLDHNQISQIDDGAFYGLDNLHQLELAWNQINHISPGWLYDLPMLRTLKVSHNLINDTDDNLWRECEFLETLDLSYNNIAYHRRRVPFEDLTRLLEFSLSHNQIGHIRMSTFYGLSALQALDLSHNALFWPGDRPEVFVHLASVIHLNLSHNHIETIKNDIFSDVPTLEYLDLSGNPISSIENNAFTMIHGLSELLLNSADMVCDCQLEWFPKWIKQFGQKFSIEAECALPEHMSGVNILDVDYNNITCDPDNGTSPVIVSHPESTLAVIGQNVSLMCTATLKEDLPYTFNWLKDGEGTTYKELQSLQDAPNPAIEVFKQKGDGQETKLTTILHLPNIQKTSQGKYQCSISNNFGRQVSKAAEVKVFDRVESAKPIIKEHPVSTFTGVGNFFIMKCVAAFSGDSPYSFTWWRDGEGPLTPRTSEDTSGPLINVTEDESKVGYMREITTTLEITVNHPIDWEHWDYGEIYQCAIANNFGRQLSKKALVFLLFDDPYEWPFLITHPKPTVAVVGQNVTLQCDGVYNPNPEYEYYFLNWLKNGVEIYTQRELLALLKTENPPIEWIVHERGQSPNHRTTQELTTLLHLNNIQEADQGNYQCVVTNALKAIPSKEAAVTVYSESPQPIILEHPTSVLAMRGTNVSLTCIIAFSGEQPYVANWLKDATALYSFKELQEVLESPNPSVQVTERQIGSMRIITNILHLNNIQETEEGTYQCSISNNFGRSISHEAVVTVHAFPKFTVTPRDNTVPLGGNVKLQCGAGGYPTPDIIWMKDDNASFPADHEMRFISMPNKDDFFIVNAKQVDEGMYSCVASNDVGRVVANAELTVKKP